MASTLGLLPQFDGSAAGWDVFAEQLTFYCIANGIEDADKKRAILLNTCGTATYKLLKILVAPADLTGKSFDELVQLAREHYTPKPSIIMCRFRFNTSIRQAGESITQFVTRLRDLASPCEFGDCAKEVIRDRLVCGVCDDTLQRTLLAVAKLTYDKAYELAVLHESAAQNSHLLSSSTTAVQYTDPGLPGTRDQSKKPCYRCGGKHSFKTCRFKDFVCNFCSKKGHIQRVCQSRLRQSNSTRPSDRPAKSKPPSVHNLEEKKSPPPTTTDAPATEHSLPTVPPSVEYDVFVVATDRKVHPYLTTLSINRSTLQMRLTQAQP